MIGGGRLARPTYLFIVARAMPLRRLASALNHLLAYTSVLPTALFAQWKRRGKFSDEPEFTYDDAETLLLKVAIAVPLLVIAVLICRYAARRVASLVAFLFKKPKTVRHDPGPSSSAEKRPPGETSDPLPGTVPPPM